MGMERVDRILKHRDFLYHLKENQSAEAERCFCRHGMEHFLDVARIGYIINLEEKLGMEKELVYGAALLHDIGKHRQYREGIPHEKASADIAPGILADCGFRPEEISSIREAILSHRETGVREEKNLKGLLYRADKASRACFSCRTQEECNWKEDKKNVSILY